MAHIPIVCSLRSETQERWRRLTQEVAVRPASAFYHPTRCEFLLRYNDVRNRDTSEQELMEFFQSAYEAGATLGQWDRETLERER